jgi:uncharacterized protein YndB with AHSA1/START domain
MYDQDFDSPRSEENMGMKIGSLHVRRSILIQAAPSRVWQEFESFERVSAWLNLGHELHTFESTIGGEVKMSVGIGGERRFYAGTILIFDPEREVSFDSQWEPPHGWPLPTFWTIRLTPVYDATLVEIFHHGFERLGAEAADNLEAYEDGWDGKHLKALRSIVES